MGIWPRNIGSKLPRDQHTGDMQSGNQPIEDLETGEQQSGDQKTGDQKTGDQQFSDQKTGDQQFSDQKTGDQKTGDQQFSDQKTGDQQFSDQKTGDQKTGDQQSDDQKTGDQQFSDQKTGDRLISDQQSDDQKTGYQRSGDRLISDQKTEYQQSGDRPSSDHQSGDRKTGDQWRFNRHLIRQWWAGVRSRCGLPSGSGEAVRSTLGVGLGAAAAVTAVKILGELSWVGMGLLSGWELDAYDLMVRLRSPLPIDPRLVVVGITETDVARYGWPLNDAVLGETLATLQDYEPQVIGLDLYRNIPQPPGSDRLADQWAADNLFGILELGEGQGNGVDPPPLLPPERAGFNDLILDQDGVVRRFLVFAQKQKKTYYSLAWQVAYAYLQGRDPEFTLENEAGDSNRIAWGRSVLQPLDRRSGGYQREDDRGYQLLLDYRSPNAAVTVLSLATVLERGPELEAQLRHKIVLIGNLAPSTKDLFFTPYTGTSFAPVEGMANPDPPRTRRPANTDFYGVMVHAQIVSYLLDLAQGDRGTLGFWPEWAEVLWIALWGGVGAAVSRRWSHPGALLAGAGLAVGGLWGLQYGLFLGGVWVPGVAPSLSLGLGLGGMVVYRNYRIEQEKQQLAQQAQAQEVSIALLQQLLQHQSPSLAASLDPTLAADGAESFRFGSPSSDITLRGSSQGDSGLLASFSQWPEQGSDDSPTTLSDLAEGETQSLGEPPAVTPMTPSQPRAKQSPPKAGLLGGRYQIQSVLGAGGFAMTYLAQDCHRPSRPICVIKRLCPLRQDPKFLALAQRLFDDEASILEILGKHDQIPQLLAHFNQDNEFYLVQEFIAGHDLRKEFKLQQQWSEAATIDLLRKLLPVLAFIHDRQIIHRDLKPSNVMRREDGKLVLIDFGTVKHLLPSEVQDPGPETKTMAVGTPGYGAPEQMAGYPQLNSDLYALGMMAIQALTGVPPHHLKVDPHRGELNWRPLLDRSLPLMPILERLTHFNSSDRYASAAAVLRDLDRL